MLTFPVQTKKDYKKKNKDIIVMPMATCPDCKKKVVEPNKTWKYGRFTAYLYLCSCGAKFREYTLGGRRSFTLKYVKGKGYRKA